MTMSGGGMSGGRGEVLLGVGGGAACFKSVALASALAAEGFAVRTCLTAAAEAFVRPLSFQAVTGGPVVTSSLAVEPDGGASHIAAGGCVLMVVAPATADLLAKLALGFAGDAVTLAALCQRGPRILCPAMNDRMWESPPVRRNLERLREDGWEILGPVEGRLAEGYSARGRMVEVETILERVLELLPETDSRDRPRS